MYDDDFPCPKCEYGYGTDPFFCSIYRTEVFEISYPCSGTCFEPRKRKDGEWEAE